MFKEYMPDEQDLKDFQEFADDLSHRVVIKKEIFYTATIDDVDTSLTSDQFVDMIRLLVISHFPNWKDMSRGDILTYVTERLHCENDIKRLLELSDMDWLRLHQGDSYPYLENAWNRLFHPTVMSEFEQTHKGDIRLERQKTERAVEGRQTMVEEETSTESTPSETTSTVETEIEKIIPELHEALTLKIKDILKSPKSIKRVEIIVKTAVWLYDFRMTYGDEYATLDELFESLKRFGIQLRNLDWFFCTKSMFSNFECNLGSSISRANMLPKLEKLLKVKIYEEDPE